MSTVARLHYTNYQDLLHLQIGLLFSNCYHYYRTILTILAILLLTCNSFKRRFFIGIRNQHDACLYFPLVKWILVTINGVLICESAILFKSNTLALSITRFKRKRIKIWLCSVKITFLKSVLKCKQSGWPETKLWLYISVLGK